MTPKIIPNVSVDCVVFGFDATTKSLNVLLIQRQLKDEDTNELLVNDFVLTGYHVYENEKLDETATRVLKELTGLDNLYKKQFKSFGSPTRLMNEKDIIWAKNKKFNLRTITVAYYFLLQTYEVNLKDNKYNAQWFPIHNLPELGFDHLEIINQAYEDLKTKAMYKPIVFEMLPDKFTINELQDIFESVLDVKIDNRNFRRKMIAKKYLVALDEKQIGVTKKPSKLYMFSKDVYEKMYKNNSFINI
ncbi:NUDIX domain-containing protein [Lutibacter sp. A64]|uniref:NUDIX hydrolase n=1 Tax=Lutibacter sp. A64 TaxID=2918526 RepID=UPI001F061C5A|nr:NUDIX domain-containing protein [Lutibacter sp. A64]UMB54641.1 NUDIX domain-containing protein [Lutibacter sp. A64]